MDLINITSFTNFYNENLLTKKSLLKDNPTLNYVGDGSIQVSSLNTYSTKSKSIYLNNPYPIASNINSIFDFSDALEHTVDKAGQYIFQFSLMNQTNYGEPLPVEFVLKVYKNSFLAYTFNKTFNLMSFEFDKLYTFTQSFEAIEGDVLNYSFEVNSDYPGEPDPVLELYFSGFKCEFDNKNIFLPTPYSLPLNDKMFWQSRVDTTNTQSITADTDTNFGFIGTSENSNSETLITTTGLITPIYVKDAVSVDFAFNFDAPSGEDRFVDVFLRVNGTTYRAETYTMTKDAGDTEYISGSFTLPVGADFKQYGAQIVINSSVNITIENRYISVIEHTNN